MRYVARSAGSGGTSSSATTGALAAGVVAGLGVAALLAHRDVAAWWVMPVAVASDARLVAQTRNAVTIGSRPMRVVR